MESPHWYSLSSHPEYKPMSLQTMIIFVSGWLLNCQPIGLLTKDLGLDKIGSRLRLISSTVVYFLTIGVNNPIKFPILPQEALYSGCRSVVTLVVSICSLSFTFVPTNLAPRFFVRRLAQSVYIPAWDWSISVINEYWLIDWLMTGVGDGYGVWVDTDTT